MTLRRLALPAVPASGGLPDAIRVLDVVLVEARMADGTTGYGEAALVPGVAPETIEQGWIVACKLSEMSVGMERDTALAFYARSHRVAPFTVSALTAAVEMATGHPAFGAAAPVDLAGTVEVVDPGPPEDAVGDLLADGYRILRLRLTGDVAQDLDTVRRVADLTAGRARLRIDGDQAFTPDGAAALAGGLDPAGIDWLAQPCVAGDWAAAVAVRQASAVPTLVGGFIYAAEDIDTAAELGAADFVALRPMQAGGLAACAALVAHCRSRGLVPVLGGGPQSDLATWMDLCLTGHLGPAVVPDIASATAAVEPLIGPPLTVQDGRLVPPAGRPALALDIVEACTEHLLSFPA